MGFFLVDSGKSEYLKDIEFLYHELKDNYVNLEYKEKLHGFKWGDLYETYRKQVTGVNTLKGFFILASEFVSRLEDGHLQFRHATPEVRGKIISHLDSVENPFDVRLIQGKAVIVRSLPEFGITGSTLISINGMDFLKICRELSTLYSWGGDKISSFSKILRYRVFLNYFDLFYPEFPARLTLLLERKDGSRHEAVIDSRKKYPQGPYHTADGPNLGFYDSGQLPEGRILEDGIGYVLIPTFEGEIRKIVTRFDTIVKGFKRQGVKGVILDIRYNGGGNESFREILGYLTSEVLEIEHHRYRLTPRFHELFPRRIEFEEKRGPAHPKSPDTGYSLWFNWVVKPQAESFLTTIPVVLLVNELSFSSADSFANACLNFKLAAVAGNMVLLTGHGLAKSVTLPSGNFNLRYSFHEGRDPDFSPIENVTKSPDIKVEQSLSDFYKGIDTQLQSAISFLKRSVLQ